MDLTNVSYTVRFEPVGIEIEVEEDETILQAAFRQGVSLMHGCKEGQCSSCKSILLEGELDMLRYSTFALPDEEKEMGYVLLCRSQPLDDLVIELLSWDEETLHMTAPVTTHRVTVEDVERLTPDMRLLAVRLEQEMPFRAGQYVDFRIPHSDSVRSFSMSSTPQVMDRLEFMVKVFPDGRFSSLLDGGIERGDELEMVGPYGNFGLRQTDAQAVFVGGGSGMAPLYAMLHDMAEGNVQREVTFFYGARTGRDLFHVDRLRALEDRLPGFRFVPALSEPAADDGWDGPAGLVTEVLGSQLDQMDDQLEAYLCGPPPMIDAAIQVLYRRGVPGSRIYYDKFTAATS